MAQAESAQSETAGERKRVYVVYGDVPRGAPCVVFDIDGVLVDCSERLKRSLEEVGASDTSELLGEKRRRFWEVFLSEKYMDADAANPEAVELAWKRRLSGYRVVLVTGRPERLSAATFEQLRRFNVVFDAVVFRANDYRGKDHEYKRTVLEELGLRVVELHDDSEQVCAACAHLAGSVYLWRNLRPVPWKPGVQPAEDRLERTLSA
ncbi:MAG: HAD family acid phosphatase [Thermofilaceae archaeon]